LRKLTLISFLAAALAGCTTLGGASASPAGDTRTASTDPSVPRPVLATANIFGAGYGDAPGPGGGGGTLPPDGVPPLPAPPRLDFTARERFDTLAPLIGQTFFIGDGGGRRYEVPATATRLYVGLADAYNGVFYHGQPGYCGNNAGRLEVVASGVLDGPGVALDTSPPQLVGARNVTVTALRGKKRARVRFTVFASDAVDASVPVASTPASGSVFGLGRTRVTCSATDTSENTSRAQFVVRVRRSK
jgi:hypothetical protein